MLLSEMYKNENVFEFKFTFPLFDVLQSEAASVFRCSKRLPKKPFPMFFPVNYSCNARKNLSEMHFKTEGTGAATYIRTR